MLKNVSWMRPTVFTFSKSEPAWRRDFQIKHTMMEILQCVFLSFLYLWQTAKVSNQYRAFSYSPAESLIQSSLIFVHKNTTLMAIALPIFAMFDPLRWFSRFKSFYIILTFCAVRQFCIYHRNTRSSCWFCGSVDNCL